MKTKSLTPWCNLFSTESKYSITVRKSRYKLILFSVCTLVLLILTLISFTYAYQFSLAVVIFVVLFLGGVIARKNEQDIVSRFELSFEIGNDGICSFEDSLHRIEQFQLLRSSRFSFLGCWLFLQPTTSKASFNTKAHHAKKRIFIYRDSLTEQDFSRLANIISQLNHSH